MSQAVTEARGDVADIEFLGITVRAHDIGEGEVCEFRAEAGPIAPPHRHAWPETHYVVDGEIEYMVGGAVQRVGAGGFLTIPGNTLHAVTAITPVHWVEVTATGKPSGFFAQVSREANELPPDMDKLGAIAAQHDVELVLG